MKKIKLSAAVATLVFCLMTNLALKAQATEANYFIGKWDMLVKGIPQGDTHMPVVFEMKKDSTSDKAIMVGRIEKPDGDLIFSKVEADGDKVTFYFTAEGYDLDVQLTKTDADNAKGMMFNMFEAVAVRVKK
jgi:hypothetical protein